MFITGGSDGERGKVVLCLTEQSSSSDVRKLIQELRRRIRACEAAQSLKSDDLTAFPLEKSGGVVRILGAIRSATARSRSPLRSTAKLA